MTMDMGILILLMVAGTLVVAGMIVLMGSCWLTNRMLGTQPPGTGATATLATPAQVYRPVDAGPYTSPTTDQLEVATMGSVEAVPSPSILAALAITVATLLVGISTFSLGIFLLRSLAAGGPEILLLMLVLGGAILVTAGIHLVLLASILPTSWPRAAVVTAIEAVPGTLLGLMLLGMLLFTFLARSSSVPPPVRATPAVVPTAPATPPPGPAPMPPTGAASGKTETPP